ncbi:MAG: LITAF-like zinc ribbon domain-containing protein [Thiovulaceae bacterium]|nr:LITAF-like zinc ribbon domain-containing protein [Sulfurimonadaceae bacterium]
MADEVLSSVNSTEKKCPHCSSTQPKTVESLLKTNWSEFVLLILFTFGVSLFFVRRPKKTNEFTVHCSECNKTFTTEKI